MPLPAGFVPITPTRWKEFCTAVGVPLMSRDVELDGALIGWRRWRVWSVDPHAYRRVTGFYPDGYWPG
jgi:hypothetical protein